MSKINLLIIMFICACGFTQAQVNLVQNSSFEDYLFCPDEADKITYARAWCNAIDTNFFSGDGWQSEYYNNCAAGNLESGLPINKSFYQNARTGYGVAGVCFYFDEEVSFPIPNYREYIQGHLIGKLTAGREYCISYYLNLMELSWYAHNKIGAYLDDGSINRLSTPRSSAITTLTPQMYSEKVMDDTMNWVRIEGSFTAKGNETHITLGNFFEKSKVTAINVAWGGSTNFSYYLIDDVSVIPIDLDADAGKDSHAEPGKAVQIGRVGDTTTQGLDCKWYHKGILIDSGAIISVNGSATVGAIDTYVVVQTVCGLVKTDTVTVTTVPVGMKEWNANKSFTVYPNPSNGAFTITYTTVIPATNVTLSLTKGVHTTMYDLLGRIVYQQAISFSNNTATIKVNAGSGVYIIELTDEAGNASRQRIVIE